MNKIQQKSTNSTLATGLTPIQEQAAVLLASGNSITDVASQINVNRATIYLWQQKITFQCFYNQQCKVIQDNIKNGLCGLHNEALAALKNCLQSDNDAIRLKAAMYVIGKVEMIDTSKQDPKEEIKKACTSYIEWNVAQPLENFDQQQYDELLKENGLI